MARVCEHSVEGARDATQVKCVRQQCAVANLAPGPRAHEPPQLGMALPPLHAERVGPESGASSIVGIRTDHRSFQVIGDLGSSASIRGARAIRLWDRKQNDAPLVALIPSRVWMRGVDQHVVFLVDDCPTGRRAMRSGSPSARQIPRNETRVPRESHPSRPRAVEP